MAGYACFLGICLGCCSHFISSTYVRSSYIKGRRCIDFFVDYISVVLSSSQTGNIVSNRCDGVSCSWVMSQYICGTHCSCLQYVWNLSITPLQAYVAMCKSWIRRVPGFVFLTVRSPDGSLSPRWVRKIVICGHWCLCYSGYTENCRRV